jgi:hypothetical protein
MSDGFFQELGDRESDLKKIYFTFLYEKPQKNVLLFILIILLKIILKGGVLINCFYLKRILLLYK